MYSKYTRTAYHVQKLLFFVHDKLFVSINSNLANVLFLHGFNQVNFKFDLKFT